MSDEHDAVVQITAVTAQTANTVRFGANVQWVRITNNQPGSLFVLGHGENPMFVVWPGDVWPHDFGSQRHNQLRIYTDVVPAAADMVYIHYRTKRRDD